MGIKNFISTPDRKIKKDIKKNRSATGGFTLIEVVLVLAIGGLIFLLAFLAFQQASINRRDTQRRGDAGRVLAELQNYQADHGSYPANVVGVISREPDGTGKYALTTAGPHHEDGDGASDGDGGHTLNSSADTFYNDYMGGYPNFSSPLGKPYAITSGNDNIPAGHADAVRYAVGFKCDRAAASGISPGSSGSVAVQITLEKGIVCRDSQ